MKSNNKNYEYYCNKTFEQLLNYSKQYIKAKWNKEAQSAAFVKNNTMKYLPYLQTCYKKFLADYNENPSNYEEYFYVSDSSSSNAEENDLDIPSKDIDKENRDMEAKFLAYLFHDYERLSKIAYTITPSTINNCYYLQAIEYYQNHKEEFYKKYNELKDNNFEIKDPKDSFDYKCSEFICILEDQVNSAFFNLTSKDNLDNLKIFNEMSESTDRYSFLGIAKKSIEKSLSRDLKNGIVNIIKTLKEIGLYETYLGEEKKQYSRINLQDFIDDDYDISQNLDDIPIEDLSLLSAYYLNRYTKVLDNYAFNIFYLDDLNLLSNIHTIPENLEKVKDSTLYHELIKYHFFDYPYKDYRNYINRQLEINEDFFKTQIGEKIFVSNNEETGNFVITTNDIQDYLDVNYQSEYENYFNSVLPEGENDIKSNMSYYSYLSSQKLNVYYLKDQLVRIAASRMPLMQNSGICINDSMITSDELYNLDNNQYVVLAFDVPKLTHPIMLHEKLETIKDYYFDVNKTTKIPLYIGTNDFDNSKTKISRAMLSFPFTDEQKRKIISEMNNGNFDPSKNKILLHFMYLFNNKHIPASFIDWKKVSSLYERPTDSLSIAESRIVKSKVKTSYDYLKRYKEIVKKLKLHLPLISKEYVDLNTGKFYIKKNGEYAEKNFFELNCIANVIRKYIDFDDSRNDN